MPRALTHPFRRAATAFTMAEIIVVIGIIVLFIALAIPAMNAITGSRSIASAENNLSAMLSRAREEAIGVQDYRGVMFYLDVATDTVGGVIVKPSDLGPAGVTSQNPPTGPILRGVSVLFLDTVANRDTLLFPKGVRVQTIFDGFQVGVSDRYFGLNSLNVNGKQSVGKYGGVILFDGMGRLVVRPYSFQLRGAQSNGTATPTSGICDLLKFPLSAGDPTAVPSPFTANPNSFPVSQIGVVLFDRRNFLGANNNLEGNVSLDSGDGNADAWLDTNGTALLVNRYTGTLIRGE